MTMDLDEGLSTLKRRHMERTSGGAGAGAGNMIPDDRISSLPESIISHILSLLPTKSAVLTSFLSKSWKFRWTKVTAFNFTDREWPNRERSVPETRGAAVPAMNFVEFVNLVFISHSESIHRLRLRWQSCNLRSVYLNIWLNAAIARNFRVLDLATFPNSRLGSLLHSDVDYEFDLPAGLYTLGTLEVLKLRGPIRIKLPHKVHLPKLAVMELVCVKFESDESVAELISACSMLETLKIERHHHHGDLLVCKVSSPSLKRLEICFYYGCEICDRSELKLVIDTPSLEYIFIDSSKLSEITCIGRAMPVNEVEIIAVCLNSSGGVNGVAGLLEACSGGVKVLTLWERSMLALCWSATPLPARFGRLTKLVVEVTRTYWCNLMDLIERCVVLQVLDITIDDNMVDEGEAEWVLESLGGSLWRRPGRVPACLSSSLKRVYFRSFEGLEDEMAMLKFLLDHGSLIERVALSSNKFIRSSCQQKLNILNEVSMLSRASAICKISFS